MQDLQTQRQLYKPNATSSNPAKDLKQDLQKQRVEIKIKKPTARPLNPEKDLKTQRKMYKDNIIFDVKIYQHNARYAKPTQDL